MIHVRGHNCRSVNVAGNKLHLFNSKGDQLFTQDRAIYRIKFDKENKAAHLLMSHLTSKLTARN